MVWPKAFSVGFKYALIFRLIVFVSMSTSVPGILTKFLKLQIVRHIPIWKLKVFQFETEDDSVIFGFAGFLITLLFSLKFYYKISRKQFQDCSTQFFTLHDQ